MYQISARGPRAAIETAWDTLAWTDPSPAGAVDAKEDTRLTWRLDAYAETREDAEASAALSARPCNVDFFLTIMPTSIVPPATIIKAVAPTASGMAKLPRSSDNSLLNSFMVDLV